MSDGGKGEATPPDDVTAGAAVEPVVVRKVKSVHGTRVARRIVCTDCHQSDVVDFIPRDPGTVSCRRCAFEKRGVVDPDRSDLRRFRVNCTRCGGFAEIDACHARPAEVLCNDCVRGIETRQEDRSRRGVRNKAGIVRVAARNRRRPPEDLS